MHSQMKFLHAAENRISFFKRIAALFPSSDQRYKEIERAYNDAKDAFRGKFREDGERYFEHLRAVALILIEYLRVKDYTLIIAALLHDIVEDSPYWTVARIEKAYGKEVAILVDWLSKPPLNDFPNKERRDAFYHGRFLNAPRAFFVIKLADRLHNLITLAGCSEEKQERKIQETKFYYLPYAERELILLHEIEDAILRVERKLHKKKRTTAR